MSPARERLDGEDLPTPAQLELWVHGPREVVPSVAPGPDPERIAKEAVNEAAGIFGRLVFAVLLWVATAALVATLMARSS